jgi:hypothetical protein
MPTHSLVRDETPVEFFREQLEKALEHQRVSTSAFTEYYLVNLLAGCVNGDPLPAPDAGYDEMPLALLLARAQECSRFERTRLLRSLGDSALFVSGFFADSVRARQLDLGYYQTLGGQAYLRLARDGAGPEWSTSVFDELARRFAQFADVLSEVSEASRLVGDRSILALYERWVQTRSRRAAALLAERGITPVLPGENRMQ